MEFGLKQTVALIFVVLVIITVLIFIAKPDIFDWFRNLPEYNYEHDEEISIPDLPEDAKVECPIEIGYVDDGKSIRFKSESNYVLSNFVADESGPITHKSFTFVIATIINKKVIVNDNFFDLSNEFYVRRRFSSDSDVFIEQIKKMHNSEIKGITSVDGKLYTRLCKDKEEEVEFKKAWPENAGGPGIIILGLKDLNQETFIEKHSLIFDFVIPDNKRYKIELPVRFEGLNYLYIEEGEVIKGESLDVRKQVEQIVFEKDINIRGQSDKGENPILGKIYPDGSIWLSVPSLYKGKILPDYLYRASHPPYPATKLSEFSINSRFSWPYFETNLRISEKDLGFLETQLKSIK